MDHKLPLHKFPVHNSRFHNFKFGVVSDPHVALPHTINYVVSRFHLVEASIPALEQVQEHLLEEEVDFLLLPGDLTQDGEPDNHKWLGNWLAELPFPSYVIPGNHDVLVPVADERSIGWSEFPNYYRNSGYQNSGDRLYYTCSVLPGVRLIALNSNQFDTNGKQIGRVDEEQLLWLKAVLADLEPDELVLVTIHHNVIEHLPDQSKHPMGRRYMLDNAPELLELLRSAGVQLIFTGHLHVQDIAEEEGIYDIVTGSLVSYPHPYRIVDFHTDEEGKQWLEIKSPRIKSLPGWPDLPQKSREWMGDRSHRFMVRLLSLPPLNMSPAQAEDLAPHLRYFWADIAKGDAKIDFPEFPPAVRQYFQRFNATNSDNEAKLLL